MSDLNNVDQFETEETETEIDEVQAFLTEWSQKRRSSHKRKSAGRSENRDQLDKFAGFNYPQFARQQHIGNLVTCMRLFIAARLDKQAAACMSTLLHAERPSKFDAPSAGQRYRNEYCRIAEVMHAGYHLLRRHPSTLTTDQMKRYLRKARTYQLTEYGKAEISLELAGFMAEKGQYNEAYDFLATSQELESNSKAAKNVEFRRAKTQAEVRYTQWQQAMQSAAAQPTHTRLGSSQLASQQLTDSQQQQQAVQWNPYHVTHDQWSKAGRAARELSAEATKHYTEALRLCPQATNVCAALVRLQLAQNKSTLASATAKTQAQVAPHDVDAHGLVVAMSGGAVFNSEDEEPSSDAVVELADHLCRMSLIDPFNIHAAAVLVELAENNPEFLSDSVIAALCCVLDVCNLQALPRPVLYTRVLRVLVSTMYSAATAVTSTNTAVQTTLQQMTSNSSNGSPEDLNTAANTLKQQYKDLNYAVNMWKLCMAVFASREWWLNTVMCLPTTTISSSVDVQLQRQQQGINDSDAEFIALLYAVRCIITMAATPETVAIGKEEVALAGTTEYCQALKDWLQSTTALFIDADTMIRKLSSECAHSFAYLESSVAHQNHHRHMPLQHVEPQLGFIQPLTQSWWTTFPQARRHTKGTHQVENMDVEGAGMPPEQQQQQQRSEPLVSILRQSQLDGGGQASQLNGSQRHVRFNL